MKKVLLPLLLCAVTLSLLPTLKAQAEEPQLILRLRRDFGYGGFGEIEGTFRLQASGPQDLVRVIFYLDDEPVAEVAQPPFQWQFHTSSFPPGSHTMSAVGYTREGQELHSNVLQARFLTAAEARQATSRLLVTLLGAILGIMVLSAAVTFLLSGGKSRPQPAGIPQNYGFFGGAICPQCKRPFARHWWAPNLGLAKLDRCPHCGRWSLVGRASREELAAAEAALLEQAAMGKAYPTPSDEERLRRALDETRFLDE
ncbi:MAG: Ig-like domain-containing protein [Chloroflexi bacterium]|nr:Ig-like domain-containing protein [Chloroflexota bacterium]